MNFGRVDLEEGAGRTTNRLSIPSIRFKLNVFMVLDSEGYSIYSFAQLSWYNTSENELWMVDLGFLLFSSTFPFIAFFSNTCNCELWMVRSWFPSFLKNHCFTPVVPGQLRKTIERISARTMKRLNFERMLGMKSVFVVRLAPSSHVPVKVLFKGVRLQILDDKTLDSYFSHVQFSFQSFLSKQLQD